MTLVFNYTSFQQSLHDIRWLTIQDWKKDNNIILQQSLEFSQHASAQTKLLGYLLLNICGQAASVFQSSIYSFYVPEFWTRESLGIYFYDTFGVFYSLLKGSYFPFIWICYWYFLLIIALLSCYDVRIQFLLCFYVLFSTTILLQINLKWFPSFELSLFLN